MQSIETSNRKILANYSVVYANSYCGSVVTPDGKKHGGGIGADDFKFYNELIKSYTSLELIPIKFYNATSFGWRWTGYPVAGRDILVITGFYGNVPRGAKDFEQLFVDFTKSTNN